MISFTSPTERISRRKRRGLVKVIGKAGGGYSKQYLIFPILHMEKYAVEGRKEWERDRTKKERKEYDILGKNCYPLWSTLS